MADQIRIHYWAGVGLAEPLRQIVAAGGQQFQSEFLSGPEDLERVLNFSGVGMIMSFGGDPQTPSCL
jgi:hypothetical protein